MAMVPRAPDGISRSVWGGEPKTLKGCIFLSFHRGTGRTSSQDYTPSWPPLSFERLEYIRVARLAYASFSPPLPIRARNQIGQNLSRTQQRTEKNTHTYTRTHTHTLTHTRTHTHTTFTRLDPQSPLSSLLNPQSRTENASFGRSPLILRFC